jgi:hypothetical protein
MSRCANIKCHSGCGAAWLARLLGVQEVPSSNLGSPTKFLIQLQTPDPPEGAVWSPTGVQNGRPGCGLHEASVLTGIKMDAVTRFADLLRLTPDSGGRLPMEILRPLGLPMPDDVLEQFCADHGTKGEFQHQYGHLDLRRLDWHLRELPACEILAASVYGPFQSWISSVTSRLRYFGQQGWSCIDVRPRVVEYWKEHRTWVRPPILIDGRLVDSGTCFHLVEGHTRVGILTGLRSFGILDGESVHLIWVGTLKT